MSLLYSFAGAIMVTPVIWQTKKLSNFRELFLATGATGIEPAISGLTGQRVNHYTTPPC